MNTVLMRHYGLWFNWAWYTEYSLLYALLWQSAILPVYLMLKNVRVFFALEILVWACVQDMVYFLVWDGGRFPVGDWVWMGFYNAFGTWTTNHQLMLSISAIFLAFFVLTVPLSLHHPE